MREIKFRAWSNMFNENKMFYDVEMFLKADGQWWAFNNKSRLYQSGERCAIMQFTGLVDANGKEIYEGDIVFAEWERPSKGGYFQSSDAYVEYTETLLIEWRNMGFSYKRLNGNFINIPNNAKIEVIGNIYQNPELLNQNQP